jgi:dienelactone hydrolase
MYTTYTAELASHGYIVICPESNDGTAAETRLPDGTVFSYDASCPRYTKQEGDGADRAFRQAQLSRRLRETALLIGHVDRLVADVSNGVSHAATADNTAAATAGASSTATKASAVSAASAATAGDATTTTAATAAGGSATSSDFAGLRAVLPGASHIDASTVGLYGHSFGSCTVFELLQQSETAASNSSSSSSSSSCSVIAAHRLRAAVCYDPWTMPLSAASRAHGTAVPLAVMACTGFQYSTNEAREDMLVAAAAQRLQNDQRDSSKAQLVLQLEIDRAQHQNMSDSVLLAPEVARKLGLAGASDPVHMTDK